MPIYDDTREDWGAAKGGHRTKVPHSHRTGFFTHWAGGRTGLSSDSPHRACLDLVRRFQAAHMAKGWVDIGYNTLVCPHGRVIEGRGVEYQGAHSPDYNVTGYGAQFMVGEGDPPITDPAKAAMRRVYDACCGLSGRALAMRGHRDGYPTECPGDVAYAWVQAGMPAPAGGDPDTAALQRLYNEALANRPGYQVTVDGIDGPATQRAKEAYMTTLDDIAGQLDRIEKAIEVPLSNEGRRIFGKLSIPIGRAVASAGMASRRSEVLLNLAHPAETELVRAWERGETPKPGQEA